MKIRSLLFFLIITNFLYAQDIPSTAIDSTATYLVEKENGVQYIGTILLDDGREVLIETPSLGQIYIMKSDIKKIQIIKNPTELKDGEYVGTGVFTTRYAFTNNALPIKKGENYAMLNLFGPEIHFSISDKFSLGIMATWIASPLVLAGKYTLTENDKYNFSLGTMLGTSGYLNNFKGFGGLHWLTFTSGDRKKNISFSAGYGYFSTGDPNYDYEDGTYDNHSDIPYKMTPERISSPLFSIAGIVQLTSKTSLFFDSMIVTNSREDSRYEYNNNSTITVWTEKIPFTAVYFMPGMRFQSKEDRAFQFALAGVVVYEKNDSVSFPVPMVSWLRAF